MSIATSSPAIELIPSLAQTPSHDHDGHVVHLYTDDGLLIDVLSRFIGGALAVGDAALVVATASHSRELERRLSARGLDTAKAMRQGRYVTLDASETLPRLMVRGSVDESRFTDIFGGVLRQVRSTVDGEGCRIAVFGELVALLWAEGKPQEAIRVEQFWNDLARNHSFSLLCAYPVTGFSNDGHMGSFLKMCGQHSGVVPGESLSSGEERLRGIAELQQKTQALENELALRESEARFRLLVEAVQDYAIFMLNAEGNISSWNIGAERLKGYTAKEIVGKHFSCFYPEEDVRSGKPKGELVVAAKEGRFEAEGWRIRKDGSRFWANVVIDAVHDDDNVLIGFAKTTRDVTERRAVDEQLRQSQKMEAVGQLTNGVAHDFNNLLATIMPNLELAQFHIKEERVEKYLEEAIRAAERGAQLTNQLLAFSRPQELTTQPVDVNYLISEVCEMLPRTLGPTIAIETVLDADGWWAMTEPGQLEVAILNLA